MTAHRGRAIHLGALDPPGTTQYHARYPGAPARARITLHAVAYAPYIARSISCTLHFLFLPTEQYVEPARPIAVPILVRSLATRMGAHSSALISAHQRSSVLISALPRYSPALPHVEAGSTSHALLARPHSRPKRAGGVRAAPPAATP